MKFFDTNALMRVDLDAEPFFMLSSVSLQELESIKTNKNKTEDTRYRARVASRWLRDNDGKYEIVLYNDYIANKLSSMELEDTPDNRIVASAALYNDTGNHAIEFITNDVCCLNIARHICKLNANYVDEKVENIYKGYKRISGDVNYINNYMSSIDYNDWNVNEYLIIHNTEDNTDKEMRFDGNSFVSLKLPPSKYVKGKNSLQRCALDILNNNDIAIAAILGGYGSGKTALTMKMALYHVNEKGNQSVINIVREPLGEGNSVGYLKGTFEEKTDQFFLPLAQQLDGGEFELESLKQRGVVEAHIPYYCKGLTFNNSITVVDEAEDLDKKQIRLIGTRLGENSRIFLNGDHKQSVYNTTENNALIQMCNALKGNPMFATIYLEEDVRSTASKLFAHVFE